MGECKHDDVHVHLNFSVMEDIGARSVDITANCKLCGEPLRFLGLPVGLSFYQATVNPDSTELRAPFVVGEEEVPEGAPSFMIGLRGPREVN